MLQDLKKEASLNGLEIEIKESSLRTVYGAFIKFKEILFELGLTNHKTEKLFVKLKIDSNPPQGYKEVEYFTAANFTAAIKKGLS